MTSRPEVLALRRSGSRLELDLRIPAQLEYFPDHFPRFPMLPGVVQLDWAIACGREHLNLQGNFRGLSNLKFQHPILPGAQITLLLALEKPGELSFAYRNPQRPCSSGTVLFGADA
jgi:3-hydroxymyristoyl/3-hydroxydecanoyl-(acyl carrier protein) dehydratase